ncbi:MAG: OsmC family protein [Fluviicola sp.]|nr:OsmC family protein [Fluviicola sp.]
MSDETTNSRVKASINQGYLVTSEASGHQTLCDEPLADGGTNLAMTPTELFLSSLASCKLATMRMVAQRKQWDTTGLSINLELVNELEINTIYQTISFPEHLTNEQREKLTTISHKCPVSKLVTGTVHILDKVT